MITVCLYLLAMKETDLADCRTHALSDWSYQCRHAWPSCCMVTTFEILV